MKEIGGFFELELERKREYHSQAIRLNSGRNALQYFLAHEKPQKIYLPYYICDSVIEAANKENIAIEYYHINERFEPLLDGANSPNSKSLMLYVNYFGINERVARKLAQSYDNLLIDNAQAFFSQPLKGLSTFYSPRKFFGVSDGAYLYAGLPVTEQLESDASYDRCQHLLKRLDVGAAESYDLYIRNEDNFHTLPVRGMSKLTQAILASVNYERVKAAREQNFLHLHDALGDINELRFSIDGLNGPLVYPLLISKKGLKEFLISKKIYVATYWNEVLKRVNANTVEYKFAERLVPLPIDQRYNGQDMKTVSDTILGFL